jgi:hypothetical protein
MAFPLPRTIFLPLLLFSLILPAVEQSAVGPGSAQQPKDSQLPIGWKTYRLPGVPFEMSYPGDFLLDAHVSAKFGFIFALMKKPNTPWLIDIDFVDRADYLMEPFSQMSLEEFAVARAKLGCDADGPEGSAHCPQVARQKVLRNRNGLEVVEIYLNKVYEHYDPPRTTKSVVGPIYAVLLPTGGSGQVLTFKRTDNDQHQLAIPDLLKQIADSVSLAR